MDHNIFCVASLISAFKKQESKCEYDICIQFFSATVHTCTSITKGLVSLLIFNFCSITTPGAL